MRKSRFSEAQIVAVLKEGEAGMAVAEILRKHGISRNTYFNWKSKYGGTTVNELRRLRELEAETAKLKRMYAELALENAALKEVVNRSGDAVREAAGDRAAGERAPDVGGARLPGGAVGAGGLVPAAAGSVGQ